jgi:hypothetical protein
MAGNAAQALAPLTALDEGGRPVRLGTLWDAQRTVLIFVRQFG